MAALVKAHLGPSWTVDKDSDWEIHYTFHCETRVRGDGDNLQKLVQDALQGVLFVDDRRVVAWKGEIASEASQRPGTAILAWRRERKERLRVPISSHVGFF